MKRNIINIIKKEITDVQDNTSKMTITDSSNKTCDIYAYFKKTNDISENEIVRVGNVLTICKGEKLIPISNPYPRLFLDYSATSKIEAGTITELTVKISEDNYKK